MVLVDWELEARIKDGSIRVLPMMDGGIQSNSIDVRLNNSFSMYDARYADRELDPYSESSTRLGLVSMICERILLCKGAFLLAETMETISLPGDVCATLEGKSSLARLGITIHQTGGWIDCGFRGTITLELTNENVRPIVLTAGMPIAQLVFHQTEPADVPYSLKASAKYDQQTGATSSRYWKNTKTGGV